MSREEHTESTFSKHEERMGLLLWFRLSRFYNESIQKSNQHLKQFNLTVAQFDILVNVGFNNRITQQELAENLLVTKGNISQLLKKMEDCGLIRREQEWKVKYISLTEKGKNLFYEVVPKQEKFQFLQFSGLDQDEQKQLLSLLKKLR